MEKAETLTEFAGSGKMDTSCFSVIVEDDWLPPSFRQSPGTAKKDHRDEIVLPTLLAAHQRAVAISRAAAHCEMSERLMTAAINSGNKSGVQAKAGIPSPAKAEATLWS